MKLSEKCCLDKSFPLCLQYCRHSTESKINSLNVIIDSTHVKYNCNFMLDFVLTSTYHKELYLMLLYKVCRYTITVPLIPVCCVKYSTTVYRLKISGHHSTRDRSKNSTHGITPVLSTSEAESLWFRHCVYC